MRNWVEDRYGTSTSAPRVESEDPAAELTVLRRENAELGRANEILKIATAFFAGGGGRPPASVIVDCIDAHRDRFGVDPICTVLAEHGLPIAPSTYYAAEARGPTLHGFVYTAFCVDVFSRRILGWRGMSSKATPLVTSVLEQAVFTRKRTDFRFTTTGLVHQSDTGSQYTSLALTDPLRDSDIAGSIGSVGDALDNALMESAIGLYKTELIGRERSWAGRADVERETGTWVHWYNTSRLHSALGYLSPTAYENGYRDTVTAIPEVA